MKNKKGRFITFEGIDGAGKSTHLTQVVALLSQKCISVYETREPGGTELGECLRELILTQSMTALSELLLVFSARSEHLEKVICPKLDQGTWVVCDRFTDASYAYQGGGRNIPFDTIQTLERLVQKELRPDLTFYFDLPLILRKARIANRLQDRFEQEDDKYFDKVRNAYNQRIQDNKEYQSYCVVDASQPLDIVQGYVFNIMVQYLNGWL